MRGYPGARPQARLEAFYGILAPLLECRLCVAWIGVRIRAADYGV